MHHTGINSLVVIVQKFGLHCRFQQFLFESLYAVLLACEIVEK